VVSGVPVDESVCARVVSSCVVLLCNLEKTFTDTGGGSRLARRSKAYINCKSAMLITLGFSACNHGANPVGAVRSTVL
jgi:hypothetical protein